MVGVLNRRRWVSWGLLAGLGPLGACNEQAPASLGPQYGAALPVDGPTPLRLLIHPLHNPKQLLRTYQPLVEEWGRCLPGYRFQIEASRDYDHFEQKMTSRSAELLLPNPLQAVMAMRHGYSVAAMAGDPEDFRGLLLVAHDSDIRTIADLKGKRVAYPAPTALAATVLPQWMMHRNGLDVMREVTHLYVGSQTSAMLSVLNGVADVASVWPVPWRLFLREFPERAGRLRVLAQTPHLVNNAFMVRSDLHPLLVQVLSDVLLGMHLSPAGQQVLAAAEMTRFHAATDASYQVVSELVDVFSREVRPLNIAVGLP